MNAPLRGFVTRYTFGAASGVETFAAIATGGRIDRENLPGIEPQDRNREAVALLERERVNRRRHEPMREGGLFDETAKAQQSLL